MKSFLPILSFSLLITSCSTAYKTGQTPDDVYFSPARPQEEYVRVDKEDDRRYRQDDRVADNDYYNYEDRSLRMKVRNRQRWNDMDYDYYSYNPYYRNYNSYYYNSPFNSYSYWNHYYNPYASPVIILNSKTAAYNRPRTMNLRVFDPQQPNVNVNDNRYTSPGSYNNSNNTNRPRNAAPRRNVGNDLRTIFGSDNNNNATPRSSTPSEPKMSNTPPPSNSNSSGSSGSSSGSSGGSAPARRF